MAPDRVVGAFDESARPYESGWKGRLHHQIADEIRSLEIQVVPNPGRVLDGGCGTGYLLRDPAKGGAINGAA